MLGFLVRCPQILVTSNTYSARALVKKTQEPGIKLQKADFFRNDTWTSPQTNSAILEKQGYTLIPHLCS